MSANNIDEIKTKIETNAEKKVLQLYNNSYKTPEEVLEKLTNIIQSGSDEFKEKTGRSMTYSEMREMFG
jgi:hypothetical protein